MKRSMSDGSVVDEGPSRCRPDLRGVDSARGMRSMTTLAAAADARKREQKRKRAQRRRERERAVELPNVAA